MSFVADLKDAIHGFHFADTVGGYHRAWDRPLKSPGLGLTRIISEESLMKPQRQK